MQSSFSKHAEIRLEERTSLSKADVHKILASKAFVLVGSEATLVDHKLFYSKADKNYFVAIQALSGAIITIIPWHYYSRTVPISRANLDVAKRLVELRDDSRPKWVRIANLKSGSVHKKRKNHQPQVKNVPIQKCKFSALLLNEQGETRQVDIGRFELWDFNDSKKNKMALNFLRVGIRQAKEKGESCVALYFHPKSDEFFEELEIPLNQLM